MNKINAIIIDDERLARLTLRNKLNEFSHIHIIGEADSVETAVKKIESMNPDLIFLDIQLYNASGFDILDKVDFSGFIIFVTAHDQFALRAFDVNAIDYLLKPISHERLEKALQKINTKESTKESNKILEYSDKVLITQSKGMKFINISDIIYINSSGDYSEVVVSNQMKYLVYKTLDKWTKRLPENHFTRIHRTAIININKIRNIEKWINYSALIYMEQIEEPLKLSRTYFKQFKERYT